MTRFVYKAKDWQGKLVKGVVDLPNKVEVVNTIRGSGLVPLSIETEGRNFLVEVFGKLLNRVGLKDVAAFTRQLSTMMTAGLPMSDALSLLKSQMEDKPAMYEILDHALSTVRGGQSLGTALSKFSNVFGEAYVASIGAGEEGGVLEEVLSKLASNLENQDEFNGKVKGAMIYPVIVVGGMFIVGIIMMVVVIPKLLSLYADFGSKLPASTLALMAVSNFMTQWWFLFPGVFVGIGVLLNMANKQPKLKLKKDELMLKIPIMGELNKKTILANTLRTLSMMMAAGIPLVDSLKIVSSVAGNEVYSNAFKKISERVQKGFSIADSFAEVAVFPMIVNQMVATGEATGKLDEVLIRVSDYFATEAEQSVKTLTSAVEPLIMIVLGVGVGFLVIAVIMPIYNLTSSF